MIREPSAIAGVLVILVWLIFAATKVPLLSRLMKWLPPLLFCYFLPGLLVRMGIIADESRVLMTVAKGLLLPACLVLFCLHVNLSHMRRIGPRSLLLFLAGALGVMVGGPLVLAVWGLSAPEELVLRGANATWLGMTTVAGSWIGGGANQLAMKEVFSVGDSVFSAFLVVDVFFANIALSLMLFLVGTRKTWDRWLGADSKLVEQLIERTEKENKNTVPFSLQQLLSILALGFGGAVLAGMASVPLATWMSLTLPWTKHIYLDQPFLWVMVLATAFGVAAGQTPVKRLPFDTVMPIASLFLYFLVAVIGMNTDISAMAQTPVLLLLCASWLAIHLLFLFVVARMTRSPVFFVAVASQANIGGVASAPLVAGAVHPSLAPIGVLLAVLGYVLGTYGALISGWLLQWVNGWFL